MSLTLEERTTRRAVMVKKMGMDFWISEQAATDISAIVEQCWIILRIEFSGSSLHIYVNPRSDVSSRKRYDVEGELMKRYGNSPFTYGTEFSNYRLSFFSN